MSPAPDIAQVSKLYENEVSPLFIVVSVPNQLECAWFPTIFSKLLDHSCVVNVFSKFIRKSVSDAYSKCVEINYDID